MYTPIKLDKMRNFLLGMEALHLAEAKLGKTFDEMMNGGTPTSVYQLAVIIWAGLAHEDPELTPEKVMRLVDTHSSMKEIGNFVGNALKDAFGSDDEEKNGPAAENPSL